MSYHVTGILGSMPGGNFASQLQRIRRTRGWDKLRELQGRPAPTEAEREERRTRNKRYFDKKRAQLEKAS